MTNTAPDTVAASAPQSVDRVAASAPQSTDRVAHFAAKLEFETDPSDVHSDLDEGVEFVLVDSRGELAWNQGRIVGAVHLPTAQIVSRAASEIRFDLPIVVYCWGPGCNGSTRAALAFARLGYQVKEMIGGYEYWAREGYPVENDGGRLDRAPDALTAPAGSITCDC